MERVGAWASSFPRELSSWAGIRRDHQGASLRHSLVGGTRLPDSESRSRGSDPRVGIEPAVSTVRVRLDVAWALARDLRVTLPQRTRRAAITCSLLTIVAQRGREIILSQAPPMLRPPRGGAFVHSAPPTLLEAQERLPPDVAGRPSPLSHATCCGCLSDRSAREKR